MTTSAHPVISTIREDIDAARNATRWMLVFCVAIMLVLAMAGLWPPRQGSGRTVDVAPATGT